MYSKILCAIDLNRKADKAFEHAVRLAHQFHSEIILLNVNDDFQNKDEMVMSRVSVDKINQRYKEIATTAKQELEGLKQKLETDNIDISFLLRQGKPGPTIIEVSDEVSADLIVLGANGKDSISDYFLGTTASYVVENAKAPTLTVSLG
tara:strand:- start:1701 stop:2147 length:447 start_codon:yes stop_codon:yes gene_type:complete